MSGQHQIYFGPFRLEPGNEQVWRGQQVITLKPKTFTVLRYLVAHAGQLVTKEEMLDTLWPDVHVTDGVLKVCVRELRRALGDDAQAPQFIETVHRRGYRFIAPLSTNPSPVSSSKSEPTPNPPPPTPTLVGRETELAQLHRWLDKALQGERQFVFVTGEAGIGKTTLVDAFVTSLSAKHAVWIGRGQCVEHYGSGEAYLPVLDALGRLCREPGGQRLIELLHQHAPTWLAQMPALVSAAELEALQRKTQGATRERMLRELAEAIEALTAERPFVLWLEDLHWSDVSTLDWLAFVARRREQARLLVIGTFRPVEVIVSAHPLKVVKQELQLHGNCEEMAPVFLSEEHVGEYLAVRFPVGATGRSPLQGLARRIHQRTDGNPLFMVNVVDYLVAQGMIGQVDGRWELKKEAEEAVGGVPENLRQMIEQQIARLSPEGRQVLEAASVAGVEFSAMAVAAGLEMAVGEVEEQCEELARREQFLRAQGTADWPDGTVATRYSFLHALYQEVLYERVPAGRRARLHQRIGEREEAAYGDRAGEMAAELALHFERGRDYHRAIQYLQQAAENASRRSAHQEAITLLTKGLELLKTLPNAPERVQQELTLQIALGALLGMTQGFAAPEVKKAYTRAQELCQQVGETPQLFWVLRGLWGFYLLRAELQTARELGDQLFTLTQNVQDLELLLQAHYVLGCTLFPLGEVVPARAHLEQSRAFYDPQKGRSYDFRTMPSRVSGLVIEALALWLLGYPEQTLQRGHEALILAQELARPQSLAIALINVGWLHQHRREVQAAQARAEAAIALSAEQGFAQLLAVGTILRGWALTEQGQGEEGIVQMRQGLAAHWATGAELYRPYHLALLAEVHGRIGQIEEGLSALAEALAVVNKTGERYYEAELYRLKGTLTLQSRQVEDKSRTSRRQVKDKSEATSPQPPTPSTPAEAEACFHKAIEIARRQQAKSLELRAVMSLARLWQQQGKTKQAHKLLAEIYGWFTEGFDTADLKEAKALLEALA